MGHMGPYGPIWAQVGPGPEPGDWARAPWAPGPSCWEGDFLAKTPFEKNTFLFFRVGALGPISSEPDRNSVPGDAIGLSNGAICVEKRSFSFSYQICISELIKLAH